MHVFYYACIKYVCTCMYSMCVSTLYVGLLTYLRYIDPHWIHTLHACMQSSHYTIQWRVFDHINFIITISFIITILFINFPTYNRQSNLIFFGYYSYHYCFFFYSYSQLPIIVTNSNTNKLIHNSRYERIHEKLDSIITIMHRHMDYCKPDVLFIYVIVLVVNYIMRN